MKTYMVLSVILCVRGNVMLHEALCVITPQYSAPGPAYDFRGKIPCACWQTHDMVNLIASWQSN